ncbi:MAG: hypothetical protein KGL26_01480 [Pseudomonadota bacterium]|nr:hypothetical protein [Pseudomonadota bacterium]
MIRSAAGSHLWLLRHELRLAFRGSRKATKVVILVLAAVLALLAGAAGVPLALAMRKTAFAPVPSLVLGVDLGAMLLFTLMLSQALVVTTQSFYERGDLDLLLSSPLPPARLLMVRCLGIAVSVAGTYLILATPVLLPVALLDHWQVLGGYGVIAALGLSATGGGLLLATLLFKLAGPRRTKTVGQLLAAFIGASVFLLSQIPNVFRDRLQPEIGPAVHWLKVQAADGILGVHSLAAWPVRAMLGEALPFVAILGGAALFYTAAVFVVGARFAANAAAATGADAPRTRTTARAGRVRNFQGGLYRVLIRKEWRLLRRDPALLAQVLLRVLYLLPLTAVLLENAQHGKHLAIAGGVGAVTVIASMIAGNLVWITISAEDAPDLLAAAPVPPKIVRRAKLTAALVPVAVLCSPVLLLPAFYPWAGLVAVLGIVAGSLSEALIQLWYEKPEPRKNFRRRIASSWTSSIGGFVMDMGWGATAAVAASGSLWAVAVAILPIGVLALLSMGAEP